MSYEIGTPYRTMLNVVDDTGSPVNAASAVLTVTLPDSTTVIPGFINNPTTGSYYVDYVLTQEGLHKFDWVTTVPGTAQSDYINAVVFRSVIGLSEAKAFVNYDGSNEDILKQIMSAATELAENIVGSCVQRQLTDIRIPGNSKVAIRLPGAPIPAETSVTSISSIWSGGPTWTQAAGDFIVAPESGVVQLNGMIPFWMGPWKATYTVGRLVIPQSVQLAVKEIIYDMWSTQRPYGANEMEPGPEATAHFEQMVAGYQIPSHALALLGNNEMPGFA